MGVFFVFIRFMIRGRFFMRLFVMIPFVMICVSRFMFLFVMMRFFKSNCFHLLRQIYDVHLIIGIGNHIF